MFLLKIENYSLSKNFFQQKNISYKTNPLTSILYQLTGLHMMRAFTEKNFEQTVKKTNIYMPERNFLHKNGSLNLLRANTTKWCNTLKQ